jgi:hypothetical protein
MYVVAENYLSSRYQAMAAFVSHHVTIIMNLENITVV